jgi:hypothetical protein
MNDLNAAIAAETNPDMKAMLIHEKRRQEIADDLLAKNPGLPFVTAIVMSNDLASAERNEAAVKAGDLPAERAVWLTGSYARLDFACKMVQQGRLDHDWLLENLPELWRGSDPDDTEPLYLNLWLAAWEANWREPITDGEPLPDGDTLTVYRGQMPGGGFGIAWSLDADTATKFAKGAGIRNPMAGTVYTGHVRRADVLAYLTGRGESEIIVDPTNVIIDRVEGRE